MDTIREQLQRQRDHIGSDETFELPVPGFGEMLWVSFRRIEWKTIEKIMERSNKKRKHGGGILNAAADVIIAATSEIYVEQDGKRVDSVGPFQWDEELAAYFDLEGANTARQVLFQVFNNDVAVVPFQGELSEWLQGTEEEVSNEFVGNSEVTPDSAS